MVGIMLHIQSDERLRNTVHKGHCERRLGRDPQILHVKEKRDIARRPEVPSQCSKLTTTANNLEHFLFDLPLEGRVKFVSTGTGGQIECESIVNFEMVAI